MRDTTKAEYAKNLYWALEFINNHHLEREYLLFTRQKLKQELERI